MDAEARLLDAAATTAAPTATKGTVVQVTSSPLPGRDHRLSVDQALAVEKIATSDHLVDVLVGPAGAGKSTIMGALRAVWEAGHGPGTVTGLAPSAAAAEVLAEELGAPTDNTAKWLTEHKLLDERLAARTRIAANGARSDLIRALGEQIDRWQLKAGQLVIVDEASLAGTLTLDTIVTARQAGAKVLLAGDWAQLSAVDAGGAFNLLADQPGGSVVELGEVRRFTHPGKPPPVGNSAKATQPRSTPTSSTNGSPAAPATNSSTTSTTRGSPTPTPAEPA